MAEKLDDMRSRFEDLLARKNKLAQQVESAAVQERLLIAEKERLRKEILINNDLDLSPQYDEAVDELERLQYQQTERKADLKIMVEALADLRKSIEALETSDKAKNAETARQFASERLAGAVKDFQKATARLQVFTGMANDTATRVVSPEVLTAKHYSGALADQTLAVVIPEIEKQAGVKVR